MRELRGGKEKIRQTGGICLCGDWEKSTKYSCKMMTVWSVCVVFAVVVNQFPSCLASYAGSNDRRSSKVTNVDPDEEPPVPSYHCEADIKNCIEPVTSKLCSGKGACVCGTCACFNTEFEKYYGRFCEHCESCSLNLCGLLQPCVECKVHGPFSTHSDCDANCSRFPEIQIAEVTSSDEKVDHFFCTFKDAEDCEFYFVYGYDAAGHLVIIAQREKECPVRLPPPNLSAQQQQPQPRNSGSGRKLLSATVPPLFKELSIPIINDFDSPNEQDQQPGSRMTTSYNNNDLPDEQHMRMNGGVRVKMRRKEALNTEAFDLMIVCGLAMTRSSSETSQQPQYFQRNGIHFDVKNCQFIPNSQHFIFTSDQGLQDMRSSAMSHHHNNNNIFTLYSTQLMLLISIPVITVILLSPPLPPYQL